MEQIEIYIVLFAIIVGVGQFFQKYPIPIALILVVTGMLLGFLPNFPTIPLNPLIVLNIFLPLLIYQISAFASWRDVKSNLRPIALLSIGHVLFITFLVAVIMHKLIPALGWPLCFVLGAVISPPDDVAIVSIAEKVRMPERILVILQGEGMFNDATALILFRFALAAIATHEFSLFTAVSHFLGVVIGETLFGVTLGFMMGELRKKIENPMLHIIASLLTPFLAYVPAIQLGGSGIISTAMVGFIIGNHYAIEFTPEFRLISRAVWPALSFAIQNLIFLLVGLDLRAIVARISTIPSLSLLGYSLTVIAIVIIGRFFWEYIGVAYLPRILFPSINKRDPLPSWQYLFIVAWSGMRGGISLAAAFAVPLFTININGFNPRDFIIFLVFCVITATFLLQGLTLPWLLKILGIQKYGQQEAYCEHLNELTVRAHIAKVVLRWLNEFKQNVKDNPQLLEEINIQTQSYKNLIRQLKERIAAHHRRSDSHNEVAEIKGETYLLTEIINVERTELLKMWREEKINLMTRNKLLDKLDHNFQHLPS